MTGMTAATETVVTRPAGTRALLYAALSLVTAVGLWVLLRVLAEVSGRADGVMGVVLAAVSVPVTLVVALVQRLSSDRRETIRLARIAAWAVGAPIALAVAWTVLAVTMRALG
jgi:hypothetical protein